MEQSQRKQKTLIFLCWLLYFTAYLGSYSNNSNINAIMNMFGVGHADAGLVTACFFFAYGAGQIVNGILCKFYNKRFVLSGALILSAGLNLIVFFGVPFAAMKYLWLINGMAQSVLWSSLMLILGENLKKDNLKSAVFWMSTTAAAGTAVCYGISALLALCGGFRYSFFIGAVWLAAAAVIWIIFYGRVTEKPVRKEEVGSELVPVKRGKKKFGAYIIVFAGILALFAVLNNLIKDGLTTWVPSILKEIYLLSDSLSIFLTLLLPVLAIFGATLAVLVNKKIKNLIGISALLYAVSSALVFAVILLLGTPHWIPVLVCFGLVSMLMSGVNSVITSMAPLYMRESINPGKLSGILNGFCYAGSTVGSYGLGLIADSAGWAGVFNLFLILSCVPAVLGLIFVVAVKCKSGGE